FSYSLSIMDEPYFQLTNEAMRHEDKKPRVDSSLTGELEVVAEEERRLDRLLAERNSDNHQM
nr:hypothetical protein [Tanacetum cinerariifolium]